ncbi:phosphoglycerate mutase family protein [Talaromyces stipitatus ATCC 10500]|uniref:Phosphoglycerate mutase family protein n=1 Tax=Talaromyces stipitatus (strain ATCC 10500 / CBS 375.48 / QM 6759 / NRRL 1006) TaxID=441959 RepID=B8M1Y0_TALSN|nr:phosphoglycerate mutase family protein [Talaromyces stipitatus ATCC 10500]EED21358.1 phosphoglycerate mutase family protein [Talaromyces stipitatus ATCC 10500]
MPLDTIYLVRHGHRMNWTIDYATGIYHSTFLTPTGNPADPTLTAHGVRQSQELAAYLLSGEYPGPKPWRIYSSPFYRCLQTIKPSVEALDVEDSGTGKTKRGVRIENGLGEWFGASTYFDHPSPASISELHQHFPTIIPDPASGYNDIVHVIPSTRGETIPQLHNRVATTLAAIIADADADIRAEEEQEARNGNDKEALSSKSILICSHAATLIAMGRALTGNMPDDPNIEDFKVYTAGLSTYVRRHTPPPNAEYYTQEEGLSLLAEGTKLLPESEVRVPAWQCGRGVSGGWDCVRNCDCSFLSGGEERGWHFNGEESFDTGPMNTNENADEAAKL